MLHNDGYISCNKCLVLFKLKSIVEQTVENYFQECIQVIPQVKFMKIWW